MTQFCSREQYSVNTCNYIVNPLFGEKKQRGTIINLTSEVTSVLDYNTHCMRNSIVIAFLQCPS